MHLFRLLVASLIIQSATLRAAETFLVENGRPRAEIVVAERPERSVRIAADDLQTYVQKISGARLPIVTAPTGNAVKLFVGRSAYTDKLGIHAGELRFGAYRLVSGDDWMVFLGDDTDFAPVEPYPKDRGELTSGSYLSAWDKVTGNTLGHPHTRLYMHEFELPGDVGLPDALRSETKLAPVKHWGFDERGSLNAVCEFLQQLGVRWYLPGELGEIVPQAKSIVLPKIDEIVRPDFEMRRFSVKFGNTTRDTVRWCMRLGMRDPAGFLSCHGLAYMTMRDELFAKHPEWFALYGGKRHYMPGHTKNKLCLSSEEFFETTVRYVRTLFDQGG